MSEKQYRHTGKKTELKITRWHPPYHCLPNQSASWKTADLLVVVKGTRIRPYDNRYKDTFMCEIDTPDGAVLKMAVDVGKEAPSLRTLYKVKKKK